jgi:hypothetical protein
MTRRWSRALVAAAGLVAAASCATATVRTAASEPVWLVTEGEAMLAPAPFARAAVELPKNGPIIRIVTPQQAAVVTAPFPVEIQFEPRPGGAPVKMDTLTLSVLKVFEIDITDRVRPYVLEKETKLLVREAKIPSGRHRLKLLIADAEGRQSGEILEVTVR